MLRRVSVVDVQNGKVSRENAYIVVTMRFYPRFLKRELVDEYIRDLAPQKELFSEFKSKDRKLKNHNSAFYLVNYEAQFDLTKKGLTHLEELSNLSHERDVVLVCQCRDFDRCHCDLLLLWAQYQFGAQIQGLIFEYPVFKARLISAEI